MQFSTDTETGVIVGVEVTNAGTDNEQLTPMLDQLEEPAPMIACRVRHSAMAASATVDTIEKAAARKCTVYARSKERGKTTRGGPRSPCPQEGETAMQSPSGGAEWGPKRPS